MGGAFLSQPVTTKKTSKYQHRKVRVISCQMQGWRKQMEDAVLFDRISKQVFLFGVFDGHGGCEVAQFVNRKFSKMLQSSSFFRKEMYKEALQETFKMMDELLDTEQGEKELKEISQQNGLQPFEDGKVADSVGCTANIALLVGNTLYVANAGDSRAALSRDGDVIVLSRDHKPDIEQQRLRIEGAGGKIQKGRINGHLNLSRSIGDLHYKRGQNLSYDKHPITCKPDIETIELCKKDQFLIIGCDGIWERHESNSKGLIDYIRQERLNGKTPQGVLESMLDEFLAKDTQSQLGCDNMSVILIEFNKLLL